MFWNLAQANECRKCWSLCTKSYLATTYFIMNIVQTTKIIDCHACVSRLWHESRTMKYLSWRSRCTLMLFHNENTGIRNMNLLVPRLNQEDWGFSVWWSMRVLLNQFHASNQPSPEGFDEPKYLFTRPVMCLLAVSLLLKTAMILPLQAHTTRGHPTCFWYSVCD